LSGDGFVTWPICLANRLYLNSPTTDLTSSNHATTTIALVSVRKRVAISLIVQPASELDRIDRFHGLCWVHRRTSSPRLSPLTYDENSELATLIWNFFG